MISQVFPRNFQQIHIISISGHCVPFIFKICQTVAGTSRIRHFHDFSNQMFGGFFVNWPSCEPARARGGAPHWLLSYCDEPMELQQCCDGPSVRSCTDLFSSVQGYVPRIPRPPRNAAALTPRRAIGSKPTRTNFSRPVGLAPAAGPQLNNLVLPISVRKGEF